VTQTTSTAAIEVFRVDMRGCRYLTFKITPGVAALTACALAAKIDIKDAAEITLLSSAANWQTAGGVLWGTSGDDFTSLAAGATADAIIENPGYSELVLYATAASAGTIVHSYNAVEG